MGFWKDLGTSFANIGMNTIGGLIGGGINKALGDYERKENYRYNEMAANEADKRQRAQFRDLYSYSAQVKEMQKAGLNPALMYSGGASGQGGATAPQGMGTGGVQKGYSPMDLMSLSQIELQKSQANLNNAEAENVQEKTTAQQIDNYISELTKETSVEERKANLQLVVSLGEKYVSEKNYTNWKIDFEKLKSNEEIKLLQHQNGLYLAQIATEGTKQELNEQQKTTLSKQIDKWQMDVAQRYYELDIQSWNQQAQQKWWESQADNLTNRLEFDAKKVGLELDFSKTKLWVDAAVDVGKSIVYGTVIALGRGNIALPQTGGYKERKIGF